MARRPIALFLDPRLQTFLRLATSGPFKNLLRRSCYQNSKAALEAVRANTPIRTGALKASWALASYSTADGEVGAKVQPKPGSFTFKDVAGTKTLVSGLAHKRKATDAAREAKYEAGRNSRVESKNPSLYAWQIETGLRPNGKIARKVGGAKMLQRGLKSGQDPFFTGVTRDLINYIANPT